MLENSVKELKGNIDHVQLLLFGKNNIVKFKCFFPVVLNSVLTVKKAIKVIKD